MANLSFSPMGFWGLQPKHIPVSPASIRILSSSAHGLKTAYTFYQNMAVLAIILAAGAVGAGLFSQ
jgi:hypothetical protein